jgi:hypothetical protein
VLAQALIERVVEQDLIVRADIEDDGQTVLRRHAGTSGIERELADWDAHPAGAEIAEAENALAIGDDDEAHVLFRPVGEQLLQPTARGDRQIHAARLAKDVGELLARLPDRRRIHERHVRSRVRHQDGVVERLVARLQIRENEVFLQIVLEGGDLGVPARHLQCHRGDGRGQQAFETEGAALRLGESGAFVEARIAQQIVASGGSRHRCGRLDRSVRRHLKRSIRGCPLPSPNEGALAAMNADGACDQARRPREKMNKIRSLEPPGQNYTGATLPVWSGNDRLREIRPSNPHQRWTVVRSSMISRR